MNEPIQRLIERSSLGTPSARAARSTVHRAAAARVVAAAKLQTTKSGQYQPKSKGSKKVGG